MSETEGRPHVWTVSTDGPEPAPLAGAQPQRNEAGCHTATQPTWDTRTRPEQAKLGSGYSFSVE